MRCLQMLLLGMLKEVCGGGGDRNDNDDMDGVEQ